MAEIAPFRGILYTPAPSADQSARLAPPYDVISPDERDALARLDPHNCVRLILPEVPPEAKGDSDARYPAAARDLQAWLRADVLRRDATPALYRYHQIFSPPGDPDGAPINLFNGRYGPYLKHGTINANIPRGADPASITLEQAIELVDARAAAAPSTKMKGKRGKVPAKKAAKAPAKTAAKAPAKKAAAKPTGDKKSTTTKKPAAKKAAAKSKPAKKATKAEA